MFCFALAPGVFISLQYAGGVFLHRALVISDSLDARSYYRCRLPGDPSVLIWPLWDARHLQVPLFEDRLLSLFYLSSAFLHAV
jgi:hypothetical protein